MVRHFIDVIGIAAALDKDLFVSPGGQIVFPIIGASGGILTKVIFYLKDRGADWPATGADLGREAGEQRDGIYGIEIPHDADYEEALEHARDVVSR